MHACTCKNITHMSVLCATLQELIPDRRCTTMECTTTFREASQLLPTVGTTSTPTASATERELIYCTTSTRLPQGSIQQNYCRWLTENKQASRAGSYRGSQRVQRILKNQSRRSSQECEELQTVLHQQWSNTRPYRRGAKSAGKIRAANGQESTKDSATRNRTTPSRSQSKTYRDGLVPHLRIVHGDISTFILSFCLGQSCDARPHDRALREAQADHRQQRREHHD